MIMIFDSQDDGKIIRNIHHNIGRGLFKSLIWFDGYVFRKKRN